MTPETKRKNKRPHPSTQEWIAEGLREGFRRDLAEGRVLRAHLEELVGGSTRAA